jgi:predicted GNAT superfamily acetyltransferase
MKPDITIRPCTALAEFDQITDLELRIWGGVEREVTPSHITLIAAKTGGQVLGAFAGEEMIGFSLAFVARRSELTYLHSHETGVLPEYQNCGVGRQLKWAQRTDALARGFTLMEWTFDPFALRNAWFNVMKLGAVMRRYLPNVYGITTSALHGGLPTDRLVAEWWLDSPRVQSVARGETLSLPDNPERIVVPKELAALGRENALAAQAKIRDEFERLFASGYAVVALEVSGTEAIYCLKRASTSFSLTAFDE